MNDKPSVLFHASDRRDISIFEPHNDSVRDAKEGPVVFATPDQAYAAMFIVEADDSWTQRGRFSRQESWHMIIASRERYMLADKGGAIYRLSAESFSSDPTRNLYGTEWTSQAAVRPLDKEVFEAGLAAMRQYGVQVLFVSPNQFDLIKASDDHGEAIFRKLSSSI
jgi:hypothetical protein